MLDTIRSFETPEGIDLFMEVAGPLVRILAYSVDLIIHSVLIIFLSIMGWYLDGIGIGFVLISYFILQWFYPVFFEVFANGMTPGKKMFKIRVVHDDGSPVGWSASIVRNLLRVVDTLPFAYTTGLVCMVFNSDFKRLGDLTAGTLVIYQEKLLASPELPDVRPRNMPIHLSSEEQQAIIGFAERHRLISQARSAELATILAPVIGKTGKEAVEELYQVAAGLRGNR